MKPMDLCHDNDQTTDGIASRKKCVQSQITLTPELRINLLLKEYDALRGEIVARISVNYTIFTCFLVLLAAVPAVAIQVSWPIGIVGGVVALLVGIVWWNQLRYMRMCSSRVIELESKINRLVGEDVLEWEGKLSTGRKYHFLFP